MPTDRLGRRIRFTRTPSGKTIVSGSRDLDILRELHRYRYLRTTQLIALLKPISAKRFIERLGDLFHETGFVDRPQVQWRGFDARSTPMIYELAPKGMRYLEEHSTLPHCVTSLGRKNRKGSTLQFCHAMMIVDALCGIELGTRERPNERFVPVGEILARAPETTRKTMKPLSVPVTIKQCKEFHALKHPFETHVVPDGLYGIEYLIDGEKRYRFWALECERESPPRRNTTALSSTALKRAAYGALIDGGVYRAVWGLPNLNLDHRREARP